AHLSATLQGLTTVKALNVQDRFRSEFNKFQNLRSSLYYLHICLRYCFGFWTDFTSAVYSTVVIFSLLLVSEGKNEESFPIDENLLQDRLWVVWVLQWCNRLISLLLYNTAL